MQEKFAARVGFGPSTSLVTPRPPRFWLHCWDFGAGSDKRFHIFPKCDHPKNLRADFEEIGPTPGTFRPGFPEIGAR